LEGVDRRRMSMSSPQRFAIIESEFAADDSRQRDPFDGFVEGGPVEAVLGRPHVEWRDHRVVDRLEVGKQILDREGGIIEVELREAHRVKSIARDPQEPS
jgi:hypothetical protein